MVNLQVHYTKSNALRDFLTEDMLALLVAALAKQRIRLTEYLHMKVLGRPDQAFSVSGDLYTRPSPAAGYLRQQIERQGWLEQSQTPEFDGSSEE